MKDEYPLRFSEINPFPDKKLETLKQEPAPIVLLLDGLSLPENLGALFRIADAAGIAGIYGFRMKMNVHQNKIQKIARNTNQHIYYKELTEWEEVERLMQSFYPIALEYTNKSVPFKTYKNDKACMLVIGNEQRGVSKEMLQLCEKSLHIPMLGMNSSMNVSVATGIVLYHLLDNMKRI